MTATRTDHLEITITHNLDSAAEVRELRERQLIAIDWGRKGTDPDQHTGRARTDILLFHEMRERGAAVIAAYKGASATPSERLIGWVEPGCSFIDLNGLVCLPLTKARTVDSSRSFLGNLSPRQCTVQRCGNRAMQRLAALVLEQQVPRSVWSLHHLDVEWLVNNYLLLSGTCAALWTGSRSFEGIDHVGYISAGGELLGQTTVSKRLIQAKSEKLIGYASPERMLQIFAPEDARSQCDCRVEFCSLEYAFNYLDSLPAGKWLLDRMLGHG